MAHVLEKAYPNREMKREVYGDYETVLEEMFVFESISSDHEATLNEGHNSMGVSVEYESAYEGRLHLGNTWSCRLDEHELRQLRDEIDALLSLW